MKTKIVSLNLLMVLLVLVLLLCVGRSSASVKCSVAPPTMIRIVISEAARDADLKINDRQVTTDELKKIFERLAAICIDQVLVLSVAERVPVYRLMEILNILYDVGLKRVVLVSSGLHSFPARELELVVHSLEIMPARHDPTTDEVVPEPEPKALSDAETTDALAEPVVRVINATIPGRDRMNDRVMIYAYLATWIVYLMVIYGWFRHVGFRRLTIISLSHALPSVIALVMAYIFLIRGATTNIQIIIGLDSGIHIWSLWSHLWPILRYAAIVSGVINLGWLFAVCGRKSWREWIPIALTAALLAGFAFVTVSVNPPIV